MSPELLTSDASERGAAKYPTLVDCDAHNLPTADDILKYLPARWHDYFKTYGMRTPPEQGIVRARWMASRTDSWSPSGLPPGADADFFLEQLVDKYDVDRVILNNIVMSTRASLGGNQPQAFTNAYMRAANEWALHDWMDRDERLFASLCVPEGDGPSTVAEVEHWAHEERFLQIVLPFRMDQPLGHRKYRDMLEVAVAHDLPVALHPGNGGNGPLTGAGWPSYYYEDHVGFPQCLTNHIASLICEGVFDRLPRLKIVIQEGGWAWVPSFAWRLDRSWRQLRSEIPSLERAPSEYVREHFWFTTQPIEEPQNPKHLREALEVFDLPDRLMFSSDYPHWDFDAPDVAIPSFIEGEQRRKIMADNALALYPVLTHNKQVGES